MTPEEVVAHIEIQQVIMRYCRGVDRGDLAMMQSVYHPGAMDHHGPYDMVGTEFAEAVTKVIDEKGGGNQQHHITNVLIDVDGDEARAESYYLAYLPRKCADGETRLVVGAGRYVDRFAHRDGRWAIAERWITFDWSRDVVPGEEWATGPDYPAGARRAADPSAKLFGPVQER